MPPHPEPAGAAAWQRTGDTSSPRRSSTTTSGRRPGSSTEWPTPPRPQATILTSTSAGTSDPYAHHPHRRSVHQQRHHPRPPDPAVGRRPSPPAEHGWAVTSTGAGRLQPQAPPAPATTHQPDPHHRPTYRRTL